MGSRVELKAGACLEAEQTHVAPELLRSGAAPPWGRYCAGGEHAVRGEGFGNSAVSELAGCMLWTVVEQLQISLFD